jgi:aspartyl-tRNA(Asn)/glutamyl-tRNA(Gln) amidotransferase subunit A
MPGPTFASAAELADLVAKKGISPVELVEDALARIEASQPSLNAFITVCAEAARAAAREAEAAVMLGDPLPPLHGVPCAVKDLVNTAGVRTTFGSVALADNVPVADSPSVARLEAAGAILVGKTTTPEFGHKCFTEAPLFGRTANPWDLSRTCGGSSGGAAASVAAGLVPIGIGTDGGGSSRIPAACCGVVGFKQTLGLVPHDLTPDGFGNQSHITPMTRTVMDTALSRRWPGPTGAIRIPSAFRPPILSRRRGPKAISAASASPGGRFSATTGCPRRCAPRARRRLWSWKNSARSSSLSRTIFRRPSRSGWC